jgi:enolase-phosphatase E1
VIAAIVIDIEGTTSPSGSVRENLYGYTRQHLAQWLADSHDRAVESVISDTRQLAGRPDAEPAEIAEILGNWLNSDVKAEPLKTAQGLICAEGFRSGVLHGEFFGDVPPALAAWRDMGIALYVYSSGSVRNQWFDLTSVGGKREASSYEKLAGVIGLPGDQIVFLSDHPDELDAAVAAGWSVLGVTRTGEPNRPRPPHRWINSFVEVDLPQP